MTFAFDRAQVAATGCEARNLAPGGLVKTRVQFAAAPALSAAGREISFFAPGGRRSRKTPSGGIQQSVAASWGRSRSTTIRSLQRAETTFSVTN